MLRLENRRNDQLWSPFVGCPRAWLQRFATWRLLLIRKNNLGGEVRTVRLCSMAQLLWTQKQDVGPAARSDVAMAFDAARSRVVLFGGAGAAPRPCSMI